MYLIKEKTSPYYQIIYYRNGKRTKKSTKKKLKSEALKFLIEFNKNLNQKKQSGPIQLSHFQKEYEAYIRETKSFSYLRSVKLSFNQFIDFTGNIFLDQLDVKTLDSFFQSKYKTARYSASLYFRTLKAAFSTAVRWDYISTNPFNSVKQPRLIMKLPLFISEEELQLIISNVSDPIIKSMILISNDAGLRLGEVVNLKWSDLDISQKIIKISNSNYFETKSRTDRQIPLTNRLYDLFVKSAPYILGLKNNFEFIFLNKHMIRYNLDHVSKSFKKAVLTANLNNRYCFHTLRHSFASRLVQKGVSLYIVSKLLGHKDLRTSEKYSHLQPKNLFEAVDKLNQVEL
ncbi:MAG: site-specific integrase [Ignavibacteriales bacterium]|nr:site-specific integrase [Ignavibacteriales bacterium]